MYLEIFNFHKVHILPLYMIITLYMSKNNFQLISCQYNFYLGIIFYYFFILFYLPNIYYSRIFHFINLKIAQKNETKKINNKNHYPYIIQHFIQPFLNMCVSINMFYKLLKNHTFKFYYKPLKKNNYSTLKNGYVGYQIMLSSIICFFFFVLFF